MTTTKKTTGKTITKADRLQVVASLLGGDVGTGEKAARELAEKVAADPIYALQWAQASAVKIDVGRRAAAVLADAEREDVGLERAIREHLSRVTRELLEHEVDASSSSPFSNAVGLARHDAAQRFRRILQGAVDALDRSSN